MKWIDEKVFQKYFKESFKKYNSWVEKEYGEKLVSVRYNEPFDRYPDLWCVLESGKTIPVEVEWRTKDFNHDPQILVNQNGFIVVLQKIMSLTLVSDNLNVMKLILDHGIIKTVIKSFMSL